MGKIIDIIYLHGWLIFHGKCREISQPHGSFGSHISTNEALWRFPTKNVIILVVINWLVLSDEQMSKGWAFALLNDEQMSNKVGVEHQPGNKTHVIYLSTCGFRTKSPTNFC